LGFEFAVVLLVLQVEGCGHNLRQPLRRSVFIFFFQVKADNSIWTQIPIGQNSLLHPKVILLFKPYKKINAKVAYQIYLFAS
jgi:hypothetical protein